MTREEALETWLPVVEMAIVDANIPEAKEALEMAIKALEQEPCGDCISRESVNDLVRELGNILNCTKSKRDVSTVLTDILYLPSVTPQPKIGSSSGKSNKWIPVSERLPEEAGMYLCSYDYDYVDTSYFDISMNEFNIFHEQVTAWMPLPKPYQPEI